MLASLAIIGGCWQKKAKLREGSKKMNGNFHTFADPSLPPALKYGLKWLKTAFFTKKKYGTSLTPLPLWKFTYFSF